MSGSNTQIPHPQRTPVWQPVALVAAGAVVFVLLLFADRTLLNNESGAVPASVSENTATTNSLPALPEGPDGQVLRGLAGQYAAQPGDTVLLGKLIAASVNARRSDLEAMWRDSLALYAPTTQHLLAAGGAYGRAIREAPVADDPSLRSRFARRGYEILNPYVAAHPEDLGARQTQALLYVESGDGEIVMEGIKALRALADEHPSYVPANLQMARFSFQTGQYEKAIPRLDAVLAQEPNHPEANLLYGLAYVELKQYPKAKPYLNQAANANDPQVAQAAREALGRLP